MENTSSSDACSSTYHEVEPEVYLDHDGSSSQPCQQRETQPLVVSTTYCQSCLEAFSCLFANLETEVDSKVNTEVEARIHDDLQSLEASAALGCQSCRLIRHTFFLNQEHNWKIDRQSNGPIGVRRTRSYQPNNLTFSTISLDLKGWQPVVLHFREQPALSGFEEQHAMREIRYQVSRVPIDSEEMGLDSRFDSKSDHAFALMRRWLETCQSEHGNFCNHITGRDSDVNAAPFAPTRLIEISENGSHLRLRLVLSRNITTDKRPIVYTTLSYCWGQYVDFFTTTHDNYEEHMKAIDIDKLPATFLHAVLITHRLGVKHLWIDALCIIQPVKGDTTDWDVEAPMMHDVYRWSFVTISATSAKNVTQGCFADRLALKYPLKPCLVSDLSGRSFGINQRHPRELMIRPRMPIWQVNVELAPVSRRGWILQERLLSRRILHFTEQAIFWECAELKASEYEPEGCDMTSFAMSQLKDLITGQSPSAEWCRVVEKYSERKLTYGPDKLPALSGIAAFFHTIRSGTYLAGLWKQDLPASLLWWAPLYEYDKDNKPPPRTLNIPSWSWASIATSIDFNQMYNNTNDKAWEDKNWALTVLEASIELATDSPFGRTLGGLIRVCGRFRTFNMQNVDTAKILTDSNIPLNTINVSEHSYMCADEAEWLLREDLTELKLPCILLHQEPWVPYGGELSRLLSYISLEPVSGSNQHQYTRVGVLFDRWFKAKEDKDQPDDEDLYGTFAEVDII